LIIVKGFYKKGQIFCETISYKKGRREYFKTLIRTFMVIILAIIVT
jgi:hypothetical protein